MEQSENKKELTLSLSAESLKLIKEVLQGDANTNRIEIKSMLNEVKQVNNKLNKEIDNHKYKTIWALVIKTLISIITCAALFYFGWTFKNETDNIKILCLTAIILTSIIGLLIIFNNFIQFQKYNERDS